MSVTHGASKRLRARPIRNEVAPLVIVTTPCHTPVLKEVNRNLHTYAQDVQITRTANSKVNSSQCYDYSNIRVYLLQNDPWAQKRLQKSNISALF
jgi:hypothetical protein